MDNQQKKIDYEEDDTKGEQIQQDMIDYDKKDDKNVISYDKWDEAEKAEVDLEETEWGKLFAGNHEHTWQSFSEAIGGLTCFLQNTLPSQLKSV